MRRLCIGFHPNYSISIGFHQFFSLMYRIPSNMHRISSSIYRKSIGFHRKFIKIHQNPYLKQDFSRIIKDSGGFWGISMDIYWIPSSIHPKSIRFHQIYIFVIYSLDPGVGSSSGSLLDFIPDQINDPIWIQKNLVRNHKETGTILKNRKLNQKKGFTPFFGSIFCFLKITPIIKNQTLCQHLTHSKFDPIPIGLDHFSHR